MIIMLEKAGKNHLPFHSWKNEWLCYYISLLSKAYCFCKVVLSLKGRFFIWHRLSYKLKQDVKVKNYWPKVWTLIFYWTEVQPDSEIQFFTRMM